MLTLEPSTTVTFRQRDLTSLYPLMITVSQRYGISLTISLSSQEIVGGKLVDQVAVLHSMMTLLLLDGKMDSSEPSIEMGKM